MLLASRLTVSPRMIDLQVERQISRCSRSLIVQTSSILIADNALPASVSPYTNLPGNNCFFGLCYTQRFAMKSRKSEKIVHSSMRAHVRSFTIFLSRTFRLDHTFVFSRPFRLFVSLTFYRNLAEKSRICRLVA